MRPMRHLTHLIIILVALVAIGPYAPVGAEKPESVPAGGPFDEILASIAAIEETMTEIRDLLTGTTGDPGSEIESLRTTMDENFTDVDTSLDVVHSDMDAFRAEVGENFTAVTAALDRIEGESGQGTNGLRRLHTAPSVSGGKRRYTHPRS